MYLLLIGHMNVQYRSAFVLFLSALVHVSSISEKIDHNQRTHLMEKYKIVPDIIDSLPSELLQVSYAGKLSVTKGNELTPTQTKDPPVVEWASEPDTFYSLAMLDPDAPSRSNPKFREWAHWLVVNIPGSNITKGDVLVDYVGAAPPKDSGLHRYVFLVYKQPKKLEFDEKTIPRTSGAGRKSFSIRKFASKYKMAPIAVNLFQAQHDAYCSIIYKQLSG